MATPHRQPRPATDNEALRAKLATMTYSFAQQLPQLSSHTPPPPPHNPQSTPGDDPNFPKLTSKPVYSHTNTTGQTLPRAWDSAKRPPTPGRPPKWANGTGKPATAAEVVASAPSDVTAQSGETAESEKQEAEFALYSKLVPTTSAVPRNPGSSLGGGGLRATGSVAAQKGSRSNVGAALYAPQPLPSFQRKEPMASRMRSLSSDASKPQLARRVAKLNRSASATPPPAPSVPSSASSNTSADGMESETTIDDELEKAGIVTLAPILKRDDLSHFRNPTRDGPLLDTSRETSHSTTQQAHSDLRESRVAPAPSRRLDEAFLRKNRVENGVPHGMTNGRKTSLSSSRRGSALSPPPGHRKSGGKDLHAKSGSWIGRESSEASVPPGFEGRSTTVNRSTFARPRNMRSETDSINSSRPFDRGNPPARPQNARADALREALNSRRRSNSPGTSLVARSNDDETSANLSSAPSLSMFNGVRRRSEKDVQRSGKAENDFKRFAQNSTPYDRNKGLRAPDSLRHRRPVTGYPERHRELSERKKESSSAGSRAHGTKKLGSAKSGKETGLGAVNGLSCSQSSDENEQSVKTPGSVTSCTNRPTTTSYLRQIHCKREDKSLTSVPQLRAHYPAYQNGGYEPPYSQDQRGQWDSSTGDVIVSGNDKEPFVNKQLGQGSKDGASFSHSSSFAATRQNASTSLPMIDEAASCHGNAGEAITKSHAEGMDDVVLPPLPNSEDVGFESMLRSMGWTPLDEDEGPRNYERSTSEISSVNESDVSFRHGVSNRIAMHGAGNTKSRNVGNGYYSHFQ